MVYETNNPLLFFVLEFCVFNQANVEIEEDQNDSFKTQNDWRTFAAGVLLKF